MIKMRDLITIELMIGGTLTDIASEIISIQFINARIRNDEYDNDRLHPEMALAAYLMCPKVEKPGTIGEMFISFKPHNITQSDIDHMLSNGVKVKVGTVYHTANVSRIESSTNDKLSIEVVFNDEQYER